MSRLILPTVRWLFTYLPWFLPLAASPNHGIPKAALPHFCATHNRLPDAAACGKAAASFCVPNWANIFGWLNAAGSQKSGWGTGSNWAISWGLRGTEHEHRNVKTDMASKCTSNRDLNALYVLVRTFFFKRIPQQMFGVPKFSKNSIISHLPAISAGCWT